MRFRTKIYLSIIALLLLFGVSQALIISRIATRNCWKKPNSAVP